MYFALIVTREKRLSSARIIISKHLNCVASSTANRPGVSITRMAMFTPNVFWELTHVMCASVRVQCGSVGERACGIICVTAFPFSELAGQKCGTSAFLYKDDKCGLNCHPLTFALCSTPAFSSSSLPLFPCRSSHPPPLPPSSLILSPSFPPYLLSPSPPPPHSHR